LNKGKETSLLASQGLYSILWGSHVSVEQKIGLFFIGWIF